MVTETDEKPESPGSAPPVGDDSLRRRVIRGIRWEVTGQFGMQAWRFGSNLVLTRLLVPDAYGLIGIVQVFMMAVTLLSDLGLQSSVIHDKRGEERRFLDTVWTVGVIRGWIVWLATCVLAYPFASFFDMPELVVLLPVTAISAIVRGFASTSLWTANRNLKNDWYVRVDVGSQILGTTFTVLIAVWLRSALALALGWVATSVAFTVFSYCRRDIRFNRFHWDREIVRGLSRFGRWALASGAFTIVQQRGDRLALGKIISTAQLGTYVIGSNLALMPMTVFFRLNSAISQPLYARVRHLPPESARSKIRILRLGLVAGHAPVLVLLVLFGQPLVDLLYESKYQLAGWYCSMVALACLVRVGSDMGPIYLAHGNSWAHFKIMAVRTVSLIIAMIAGYLVGRSYGRPGDGVLYGIVVAPLLAYPYQSAMYHRVNAWLPEVDVLVLIPAILLVVARAWGVF